MTYKEHIVYNPTVTDLRHAYEVAHGHLGVHYLIGALFANVTDQTIERLYQEALEKVREDTDKLTVCVYCLQWYSRDAQVCPECNEYDGMMVVSEARKEGHIV